jgi:hypothetical protein
MTRLRTLGSLVRPRHYVSVAIGATLVVCAALQAGSAFAIVWAVVAGFLFGSALYGTLLDVVNADLDRALSALERSQQAILRTGGVLSHPFNRRPQG